MYRIGKHRTFGMILNFCPEESWRSCARFRSAGPALEIAAIGRPKTEKDGFFRVGFYKAKKNICRGGTRTTHFETCKWRGRMSHISALGVVWVWTQMTFFSTWTIWATFASKQECLKSQETRGSPFQHMHIEWRNITRSKTHQRHSILYPRPIKPPFPALVRTMWGLVLPRHLVFFRFFLQNLQCFATMKRNFFTWQVCNNVLFLNHSCASYYNIVGSNVGSLQAEIKEMKAAFDLIDFDGPAFNSGSEGRMKTRVWSMEMLGSLKSFIDFLHALCPFVHPLGFFVMPCVWNASASAAYEPWRLRPW